MYKKAWCACKVVVLPIQSYAVDSKVPNILNRLGICNLWKSCDVSMKFNYFWIPEFFPCTTVSRYWVSGLTPGSGRFRTWGNGTKRNTKTGFLWMVSGLSGGCGTKPWMKPGKVSVRFKPTYKDYLKVFPITQILFTVKLRKPWAPEKFQECWLCTGQSQ